MKKQYHTVIRTYFSDYVSWLLIVSFLFIVSLIAYIVFNGANKFIWIIPVSFVIIYLLSTPLLILYCKVKKDIRNSNIEKSTIRISEIKDDKNINFKNRGGATVGKNKYKIVDENNKIYLLSTSSDKDMFMGFYPHPNFSLEVEFLKRSKFILSMKIIENTKSITESRKQQHNIQHFKKTFNHYF